MNIKIKLVCSVSACNNQAEKRGWCGKHYRRHQRHGDVNFVSTGWRDGRKNPNYKYKDIDDDWLKNIDSEEKAYFLGVAASDRSIGGGRINISQKYEERSWMRRLADFICKGASIKRFVSTCPNGTKVDMCNFAISSNKLVEDTCRHLKCSPGKKDATIQFPDLPSEPLTWAFIRGYFDGDGSIRRPAKGHMSPSCSIASNSKGMIDGIKEFTKNQNNIQVAGKQFKVEWSGPQALDFLSKIYDGSKINLNRKYDDYLNWSLWRPSLMGRGNLGAFFEGARWAKTRKDAVPPSKERASDSGFDLTLLEVVKTYGNVGLYDTGIKIRPPYGWYFDLVPRSSIIKSGYMLANSIGVIDMSYTGPILVPLIKVDPTAPDLLLPNRLVQIIPRPFINIELVEVSDLSETSRGSGGFGSSGK